MQALEDPRDLAQCEVIAMLQAEGISNATPNRLWYLIANGQLPRPLKDASGRYRYSPAFVRKAAALLSALPSAKYED